MNNNLNRTVLSIAVAVLVVSGVALFFRGGVSVVIHNVGDKTLKTVVVHVTGNSYPVGDIGPREEKSVRVSAKGESHVEIEHGSGNRLVIGCYFEEGYKGKITAEVTADQVVRVRDEIRIGPF